MIETNQLPLTQHRLAGVARKLRRGGAVLLLGLVLILGGDATSGLAAADSTSAPHTLGMVADTILLQGIFVEIPPDVDWTGMERTILAPGAAWTLGAPQTQGDGPWLYRLESGELRVDADGPIAITRAGTTRPRAILSGTTAVLRAGDQGFTASGVTSRWHNDGPDPATVLEAGLSHVGTLAPSAGVTRDILIAATPIAALDAPVALTVHRAVLAPGQLLVPSQGPGLVAMYVATGTLQVLDDDGSLARPQTFGIPAGNGRAFRGAGYTAVPASWMVRNQSAASIALLLLTITDANPLETLPRG